MDPLVRSVARRYAATITKDNLEKWKKDLRLMTKIYRSLKVDLAWDAEPEEKAEATERVEEAAKLFNNFRENFANWVYKVVLPKFSKGEEPYLEKEVRKSTWGFRYTLDKSFMFPTAGSGQSFDFNKLRNDQDKNVKRYQVAATKAFKDLETYLDTRGVELNRFEPVDHFEMGGAQIILENWGRQQTSDQTEDEFHNAMNQLRSRLTRIKAAGFPNAVKGLTIVVNFEQKEWDVNGRYSPSEDKLTLYPLALAGSDTGKGTLTHECGHRFYFKELPGQARAEWEEVLTSRGVKITLEDIERFFKAVNPKIDPDNFLAMSDDEDRLKAALPVARDEFDEAKFKELASVYPKPFASSPGQTFEYDPAYYLKTLKEFKEGELVQLEEISDYGDTEPVEAFAEAFRIWVIKGPNALGLWSREFFRKIARAGGAKIASEEAPGSWTPGGHYIPATPNQHYKVVCRVCGTITQQCRCTSPNRVTVYTTCDKCNKIDPIVASVVRRYSMAIGDVPKLIRDWEWAMTRYKKLEDDLPQVLKAKEYLEQHEGEPFEGDKKQQSMYFSHMKYEYLFFPTHSLEALQKVGVRNLFLGLLQQYDLPAQVRKKVEACSRFYEKTRFARAKTFEDSIKLFKKVLNSYQEHLAIAKDAFSQAAVRGVDAPTILKAGPFRVVNTGGFDEPTMDTCAKVIEKAVHLLAKKGLGKVCYGDALISNTLANPKILAFYLVGSDEFFVRANLKGKEGAALQTIIHELAHRLSTKFLQSKQREIASIYRKIKSRDSESTSNFEQEVLSDPARAPKPGDTLVDRGVTFVVDRVGYAGLRSGYQVYLHQVDGPKRARISLQGWISFKGLKPGSGSKPRSGFITTYASKDAEENFAEMISFYCMDELPQDQVEMLELIL
jgi:hypothetical protein